MVGRTERGSPIAPADQLAGAIGGPALDGQARPLHLIRAGASFAYEAAARNGALDESDNDGKWWNDAAAE